MKLSHSLSWLSALILPLVGVAALAASLSPTSLVLLPGDQATIAVSKARGTPTLANSNPTAVSATLAGGAIKVAANAVGVATLSVTDRRGTKTAQITVNAPLGVSPGNASLPVGGAVTLTVSNPIGTITIGNSNRAAVSASVSGKVITVTGRRTGSAELTVRDTRSTVKVLVTVTSTSPPPATSQIHPGRLLASNCFQCHGTNGSGGFERLQGSGDLLSDLREFASGQEDAGGIMAAHAIGYTDKQLQLIADFLSKQ
jgi:cytochrome c553